MPGFLLENESTVVIPNTMVLTHIVYKKYTHQGINYTCLITAIYNIISGTFSQFSNSYEGTGHFGPFKTCRYTPGGYGGICNGNGGFIKNGKNFGCNPLFCSWSSKNPTPYFGFFLKIKGVFFLFLANAGS